MIILKIGGAAITDKSQLEHLKTEMIDKAALIIKNLWNQGMRFIIIHGAGSFGHIDAHEFGIKDAAGWRADPVKYRVGLAKTKMRVSKLNNILMENLINLGIPVLTVSPFSSIWPRSENRENGYEWENKVNDTPVVNSGYVPVLHGDTILADLESGKGTIISGDQLVLDLVKFYQVSVSHVVFLSSVPGVLSKSSNIIPVIYSSVLFNDKNNILNDFDNKEVDVTGAMQSKIKVAIEIANICDVFIVGLSSYSLLELNDIICRRKHVAGTLIKKQNKE